MEPSFSLKARARCGVALLALGLAASTGRAAEGFAQWNFNGTPEGSGTASPLQFLATAPATTPRVTWTGAAIIGSSGQIAALTRGTAVRARHGLGNNGGGARLNRYTLIVDLAIPSRPAGWAALLQTDPANTTDADWFINPEGLLGISNVYGVRVPDLTWTRLALVVDTVAGTLRGYVNGFPAHSLSGLARDGRWSLGPEFLLFADDTQENAPIHVNSVQLRPTVLTDAEVDALGGPTGTGIPTPVIVDPPDTRFGYPLQINGGFEEQLAGWSTVRGRPRTPLSGDPKGTARGGARYLHGGLANPGNLLLRQVIPLDGYSPAELEGAIVTADGWLRNWHAAGTFDDQVYYRIAFVNETGAELSSLRCLLAGANSWQRRNLRGALPAGTRALHLEIVGRHRRDADNDSMADDMVVMLERPGTLAPPPVITKLPMLQGVQRDAMTLLWETDHSLAPAAIEWGRTHVAENVWTLVETLQIDAFRHVHRATLPGLAAETEYVYRVRNGATVSPTFRFRTAPHPETPFVTAWWGDNHGGTATLRTHVANLLRHSPDLLCVAGDMVNNGNAPNEWHNFWFKPLEHLNAAQTTPVIFARGNHDGEHALAYAYSALPGNESWFAFDYGNTRFLFLDSEADGSASPEQIAWLRSELARPETQRAAFRVACFHKPPWSQFWNGGGHTQEPFVIDQWIPLLRGGGVDLVICGHEHAYHRGTKDGVVYVVSGGGGGALDTERVAFWPHVKVEYSRHHFDIMTVDGRRLSWETYDASNELIDEFTLVSRQAVVRITQTPAGGHELVVEGRPGLSYRIDRASDLPRRPLDWTPWLTVDLPANTGVARVPVEPDDTARFVRAVALPQR